MITPEALTVYPSKPNNLDLLGGWVSPQELPVGSLAESTSRWAITTNNMSWAYETYCHHPRETVQHIVRFFENAGIDLNYRFFDNLEALILNERKVPDNKGIINLYKKAYSETYYDLTDKTLNELEKTLLKLDQDRGVSKSTADEIPRPVIFGFKT